MYRIYCDGEIIYSPNTRRFAYAVTGDPAILYQLNKAATLKFTLPSSNVHAADIHLLRSDIDVYDGDELIYRGRPLDIRRSWLNDREVYCEDGYSWLRDGVMRPYAASDYDGTAAGFFRFLLDRYNAQASANRQIRAGAVQVTGTYAEEETEGYGVILDEMEALRDACGGDMVIRYALENGAWTVYLDWRTAWPTGQEIRFAKNLLDLEEYIDAGEVFTQLLPVGKDGLTIISVNNGQDFIEDAAAEALYGYIKKTETYADIEDPSELLAAAQADLDAMTQTALSLDISAVDLSSAGYDVDAFKIGSFNRAVSPPHQIDMTVQCTRIQLRLQSRDKSQYRFGVSAALSSADTARLASGQAGLYSSASGAAKAVAALAEDLDKRGLPTVTVTDNGKTLMVVGGEWKAVTPT